MPSGILPVLYSYYTASGDLDHEANAMQIGWLSGYACDGVTLFGLASEGPRLSPAERFEALSRIAPGLGPQQQLLVTLQPDDDAQRLAKKAIDAHGSVGLIFQIGRDPAPSLEQVRRLAADRELAAGAKVGLQIAPGLIDTEFTCASLALHPDISASVSFLKAEYNSIDLAAHLAAHPRQVDLLVGRHGQNILEYLHIGAGGIIPATEMAPLLVQLLRHWRSGDFAAAAALYGKAAPYIDFAMQDLDTLLEVGRSITAKALGIAPGRRRGGSRFEASHIEPVIERWAATWRTTCL
jgi:4-hydroxy-tetrahydrodipicolinate synthase